MGYMIRTTSSIPSLSETYLFLYKFNNSYSSERPKRTPFAGVSIFILLPHHLHYAQSRHLHNSSILIHVLLFNRYSLAPMDSHLPNNSFFVKYVTYSFKPAFLLLDFSGHSIRKGAAVTAAANGISRENIQLLGRWKSDAVDLYINEIHESEHIQKLLQLNSQLLNFTPFYS